MRTAARYFLFGLVLSGLLTPQLAISKDLPPRTGGRSGGSRGCDTQQAASAESLPALVLLTPKQEAAKTVSTRPTFAWFVRDFASLQMKFRLYRYESAGHKLRLVTEHQASTFKYSPGVVVFSLPETDSALAIGQRYLWQVELLCDQDHPSGNSFAEAEFEVVPTPSDLSMKLARTHAQQQQAVLYAEADLGYDALRSLLIPSVANAVQKPVWNRLEPSVLNQLALEQWELRQMENSPMYKMSH